MPTNPLENAQGKKRDGICQCTFSGTKKITSLFSDVLAVTVTVMMIVLALFAAFIEIVVTLRFSLVSLSQGA